MTCTQRELDDLFASNLPIRHDARKEIVAWLGEYSASLTDEEAEAVTDDLLREWHNFGMRDVVHHIDALIALARALRLTQHRIAR